MQITIVLWILVWSGIYSAGLNTVLYPDFTSNPLSFIHGARAFLPMIAAFLGFTIFGLPKRNLRKDVLLFLLLYALTGVFFFFLSPKPLIALYWGMLYASVLLVTWELLNRQDSALYRARLMIRLDYAIAILLTFFFVLGPMRPIIVSGAVNLRHYDLPFGLGIQTANGVGRVSAIAGLIALSRILHNSRTKRVLWLTILGHSLLGLSVSQSRTALLGFSLGSLVLFWIARKRWWIVIFGPVIAYIVWLSGFMWRSGGQWEELIRGLSGREYLWDIAVEAWRQSPFLGFGFHADRILLDGQHVHMAYLHSLIQTGIIGTIFFVSAFVGIWAIIVRRGLFGEIHKIKGTDNSLLAESVAILTFFTARSCFESTAAFYGVDLLFLVPIMGYIQVWIRKNPKQRKTQRIMKPNRPACPFRSGGF